MSGYNSYGLRAVIVFVVVLLAAFLVAWLVGGTVGTRLARRRDEREFALDGAQDFDDEPERERTNCGQFASYYGPCGSCDACTDAMHAYWAALKPQPALDVWTTPAPGTDPNRELAATDEEYFSRPLSGQARTPRRREGS